MNKKEILDNLVKKYEIPDFIKDDPIQFPHKFKDQVDQEISGLISSSLAYGKRTKIVESVQKVHEIMDFKPKDFALNFNLKKDIKLFNGFIYRYTSGRDVALLIYAIGKALKEYESLENRFMQGFNPDHKNIKIALADFVNCLRGFIPAKEENLRGVYHLIPSPENGSACKRLNLFLEWMVRPGPVDLDLWEKIPTSKLIIPLDTHVAKLSRKFGLTDRKVDDWKTAEEITENLKKFDPKDPVKYDFALFGMGISGDSL